MKNMYTIALTSIIVVGVLIALLIYSSRPQSVSHKSQTPIHFFCAAGMKPPIEKITEQYTSEFDVPVQIQYGGSGTLLSSLRLTQKGDIYLAADISYIQLAQKQNLIDETFALAQLTPIIALRKDNKHKIESLKDLVEKDVKIALANPTAASVGKLTKKMLSNENLWSTIETKATVFKPTVNEVANDIKVGTVDCGIIWDAVANQYPELIAVQIPEFTKYTQTITAAVLKSCSQPQQALKLLRYISATDKGLQIFKKMGYPPVPSDPWEENPKLTLYSGGVNRIAIEETIKQFEKRECVTVTRIYNGCGILVSQIKSGAQPDAYFACDVSFMDIVDTLFTNRKTIAQTPMVIITAKGNPLALKSLNDLTRAGLKIGVANPQQSALGELTRRLLTKMNIYEQVKKNIRVQTPTADLLVNQMRTGALDAAIVYKANTSQVADFIDIVEIDHPQATALQPYAIGTNSKHTRLAQRLLAKIESVQSQKRFESAGFTFKAGNQ